jgi:6-phosphofructokinase 1
MKDAMRIGVLTGGGDAPGLNAAIRAIVERCKRYSFEILGIRRGWAGILEADYEILTHETIENIIHKSGTILKTSRTNPLKIQKGIDVISENFRRLKLDALIAIGGDDTLSVAEALSKTGLTVIGIPKTIDNDLLETEATIGFDTAVNTAMKALENLKVTAESHDRIMVVEIMGRHAGWIALYSGIASAADLILIPEEPFRLEEVIDFVKNKVSSGQKALVIVVAEGALMKDYKGPVTKTATIDQFGHVYLGGIGEFLAREIKRIADVEIRTVVPAHIIRGGSPTAFDRVIATRYGIKAVDLLKDGKTGVMVALKNGRITVVPFSKALARTKLVSKRLYEEAKTFFT